MKKYILILATFIGLASCKEETVAERIITNMEKHPNDWVWQEAGIKDTFVNTYSLYFSREFLLCDTLVNTKCGIKIIIDPKKTVIDEHWNNYAVWRLVVPDTLEFDVEEIIAMRNSYNEYIQEPIEKPKRERWQASQDSIANVEKIKLKEKKNKILESICNN